MHLPEHFVGDIIATFGFAIIAIVTLLVGYKIYDKMTPDCDFDAELQKGNKAVAAVIIGLFVALAIIVATVAHAIIG